MIDRNIQFIVIFPIKTPGVLRLKINLSLQLSINAFAIIVQDNCSIDLILIQITWQ